MNSTPPGTLTTPLLEIESISKAFGHVQALDHVGFTLRTQEVVALLGDNGAGKSTLVKILSGVYQADSGRIVLDGRELAIKRPTDALRSGIATVYQELALVDTLDVARNIYLGLVPKRFGLIVDYPRMYADSQHVLSMLSVDMPSVYTRVGDLSGGQRQAVAIGRALGQDARVFLLDEPTAALGVAQTAKMNELISDLQRHGKTVLMITHNLEHVFQIADRLVVLRHGRVVGIRDKTNTSREEVVGLITGAIRGDVASDSST